LSRVESTRKTDAVFVVLELAGTGSGLTKKVAVDMWLRRRWRWPGLRRRFLPGARAPRERKRHHPDAGHVAVASIKTLRMPTGEDSGARRFGAVTSGHIERGRNKGLETGAIRPRSDHILDSEQSIWQRC
jgi:hypothetical protein